MTYERLTSQGRIKKYNATESEVHALLELASRDLSVSKSLIEDNPDWSYNISYNAMLQSSRAYMLRQGYRARGSGQHATVVQFMEEAIGNEHHDTLILFDQMRRKRHRLIYDAANLVGEREAKEAFGIAKKYVALISKLLRED
jgi:uncharacterized protein (UPF0332 family)